MNINKTQQILASIVTLFVTIYATLIIAIVSAVVGFITPRMARAETIDAPRPPKPGIAIVLGGALKYDNDIVWRRIVDAAGGEGAKFAVLATASSEPEASAAAIIAVLSKHGAMAEHIPIAPKLKVKGEGRDAREAARDPELVEKIKSSQGVFFSGGAQERITEALFEPDGKFTPALSAIWEVFNRGGVVAGTSAGAAIMSTTMFRDAPDVLNVLKLSAVEGQEIDRGLGFVGPDLFIDQHFIKRGRLGRMLPVMVKKNYKLGLGVDENSGAIIQGDEIEIIDSRSSTGQNASRGALVADLGDATIDKSLPAFNLKNAKITYLDLGDRYHLKTKSVTPSAKKITGNKLDPNAEKYAPYFSTDMFYPDILGDATIVNAISNLIDNKQRAVIGLAFSGTSSLHDKMPALGFEFKFRKGHDSVGYFTRDVGGENYSVINIYLDVTPITMSRPLYRPYRTHRTHRPHRLYGSYSSSKAGGHALRSPSDDSK